LGSMTRERVTPSEKELGCECLILRGKKEEEDHNGKEGHDFFRASTSLERPFCFWVCQGGRETFSKGRGSYLPSCPKSIWFEKGSIRFLRSRKRKNWRGGSQYP